MSKFYNPRRSRNLFDPQSEIPFRLSRSKLDLFLNCPRCFYLDRRLGIGQPPGPPFTLNSAVDKLLKKEFDVHRINGTSHPLLKNYGLNFIPFKHKDIEKWRDALGGGVEYLHKPTNFLITGGIDDVWTNQKGELIVVDYKATVTDKEINLDDEWKIVYKRQMEIYQWLFRKNGFKVSDTGYFVYCNGDADKKAFDGKLEFSVKLIPYEGNDGWVEKAIFNAHECLMGDIPPCGVDCDFCSYNREISKINK